MREVIGLTHDALVRSLDRPRIAVCGLNPHAGEHGLFGDEDARCIAPAIEAALADAPAAKAAIEECVMGHVLQAGVGQNPARQAGLLAGLPDTLNAITVNKVCGSGLQAVMQACTAIRAGEIHAAVETALGHTVNRRSVKTSLSNHTAIDRRRFERVSRGRYRTGEPGALPVLPDRT